MSCGKPPANESASLSVAAVFGGNLSFYCYHHGVTSTGGETNSDTSYNMGSLTKIFTTLLTAMAQDSKLLKLSDTLGDVLVGSGLDSEAQVASIPLAALASQTAGLPQDPACGLIPYCTFEDEMSILSGQPLNYEPLTAASYSNLGLALLGQAVSGRIAAQEPQFTRI